MSSNMNRYPRSQLPCRQQYYETFNCFLVYNYNGVIVVVRAGHLCVVNLFFHQVFSNLNEKNKRYKITFIISQYSQNTHLICVFMQRKRLLHTQKIQHRIIRMSAENRSLCQRFNSNIHFILYVKYMCIVDVCTCICHTSEYLSRFYVNIISRLTEEGK